MKHTKLYLLLSWITAIILMGMIGPDVSNCNAQTEINPGRIKGNIIFSNTSTAVRNYLMTHQVVHHPEVIENLLPIRVYKEGEHLPVATIHYSVENSSPDTNTFIAAKFDIHPNTQESGTDFVLEIDSIQFANNARYRFGSLINNSSSYHVCQNVLPISAQPEGVQCDIAECAALVNLQFRFVGSDEDLAALTSDPVKCIAEAFIEEVPNSGNYVKQAETGLQILPVDSLLSGNAVMQFLVRSTSSNVIIKLVCTATIEPFETGFVIIPGTRLSPFSVIANIGPLDCGQSVDPVIDVPVERNAGELRGLFDVSGHEETKAEIQVRDDSWSYRFTVSPPLVGADDVPTDPWIFEGVPAGWQIVSARAVVDEGDKILEFPHKEGANLQVQIIPESVVDLGSTFVSRPMKAQGSVVLYDPGGLTDLDSLRNEPFTHYYPYFDHSYMKAYGSHSVANMMNGASGRGGISYGRLNGSYDTEQERAEMNYELLINGISPVNGSTDGTDARPTPWDVTQLVLWITSETIRQEQLTIDLGQDLHYLYNLGQEEDMEPHQIPGQIICFGQINLTIQVDPSFGSIYDPRISSSSSGPFITTVDNSTYYSRANGYSYGYPYSFSERTQEVTIGATLPQGYQYEMRPYIKFVPAEGDADSATSMWLDPLTIPEDRPLGCGRVDDPCIGFLDEEGNYTKLHISILEGLEEYCLSTPGDIEIQAVVNSDGVDVAYVEYVLDDSSPVILCPSNCGPEGMYDIVLSSLQPGEHTLTITAVADNGCPTSITQPFEIDIQPLTLICPDDFSVELNPGETEISKDDPRIADHLNAIVEGGCDLPVYISNDIPDVFEIGETEVNFWIPGVTSCTTIVTVLPPKEHFIAFTEEQSGIGILKVYKVEEGQLMDFAVVENPTWVEFDHQGNSIGVTQLSPTNNIKILDSELDTAFQVNIVGYHALNIAFNPENSNQYAVMIRKDTTSCRIFLFNVETLVDQVDIPFIQMMSTPEIAWSADGNRFTALFTVPHFDSQGEYIFKYSIYVYEWDITSSGFANVRVIHKENESPIREEEHEVLYVNGNIRGFTTNKGVSKLGINQIQMISEVPNDDMDICDDGTQAVFCLGQKIGLLLNPGQGITPNIIEGPVIPGEKEKLQVAISSDKEYIAVQQSDGISIYMIPDFSFVRKISATRPRHTVFKPVID